jgi:hypothetical protein
VHITSSDEDEAVVINVPAAAATPSPRAKQGECEGAYTTLLDVVFYCFVSDILCLSDELVRVLAWNTAMGDQHLLFHGKKADPLWLHQPEGPCSAIP